MYKSEDYSNRTLVLVHQNRIEEDTEHLKRWKELLSEAWRTGNWYSVSLIISQIGLRIIELEDSK